MPIPSPLTIASIAGATRILAEDQEEFQALAIRDELQVDGTNVMVSEWQLNEEQIEVLRNGGSIYLGVNGMRHPGVMLAVAPSSKATIDPEPTCG